MSKSTAEKIGNYRWIIASLLLFSTTVNYMDRNVISFLKSYFCSPEGFGWSNIQFSYVTSIFTAFYAGFTLFAGMIIDKIGTKLGLAFSLITWSVFGILNAFAGKTVTLHVIMRSLFGAGEAGNFPASIKTVAEWFPKKERALATGIFNSGSNIGAMIAALFVPWCMVYFTGDNMILGLEGWQMAFILTGGIGFLWLIFWFLIYGNPKELLAKGKLSQSEFDYIHADADEKAAAAASLVAGKTDKVPWFQLLSYRQTWAFVIGKFMTDGIWWFLLFWLPDYLKKQFGMTPQEVMWPTFTVFGIAIIGSVFGGSIPMFFMNKGMEAYKARMTAMLLIAIAPVSLLLTQYFGNVEVFGNNASTLAVAIICIGGAAHQAWSANLFTTVSDMFPKKVVGSVTGIGAAAGGLGGVLVQLLAGFVTDHFEALGNKQIAYVIMFAVCAFSYLIAWALMKLLVPKFKLITDL
ncbi:MAG: MFS transporter [Porphyromonadaceae bacterium CG2_30_38_12]|nr:MAG: MFS transporter [Porphyromonadaceae bacterium CG2_30_38_12]